MGLGPALGRQRAHDLVYDICREVIAGKGTFLDLLAAVPEITAHMDRTQLAALLDPANYCGLAGEMVDRVLALQTRTEA
jgi:3-carboxy-cis,cis-muconate cycloisomerase